METIAQSYHKHYKPDEHNGICVVRRKGESVEDLIKRFRKKYSKSGLAKEVREKMYFEKPSAKRKRKKAQSLRNIKREEEKIKKMKEKLKKAKQKRISQIQKQKQKQKGVENDKRNQRQSSREDHVKKENVGGTDNS